MIIDHGQSLLVWVTQSLKKIALLLELTNLFIKVGPSRTLFLSVLLNLLCIYLYL